MNWKKIIGIIAILVIIAIVIVRLKSNKESTQKKVYQYDEKTPITVQVDTIKMEYANDANTYTGTFEPNKETKISAEVQGKINSVLVDVGSYVNKGQPLVQLDNTLLKLQLQTIDVQLEGLQNDVNRYTILTKAEAVQGVQLEKATLGWKAAKVQRATIAEQISKTSIRAPFSGVVTFKFSDEGAFAAPGIPLLQITDINTLRFTVNIPEQDLNQFKLQQSYQIAVDVHAELQLSGKVMMIGSKSNMGNSFPIQFHVANTKQLDIKSGMFGKLLFKNSKSTPTIIISSSAINEEGGKAQVYLVKNGKAVLQTINIAKNIGNKITVASGLQTGDVIITNGFINLYENANVTVK